MAHKIALIGIGNPLRGDDGVGLALLEALAPLLPPSIACERVGDDMTLLLDCLSHYRSVYCLDACDMQDPPGAWRRVDIHEQPTFVDKRLSSTHTLSLTQTLELAKVLHPLPSSLIFYLVQGKNYSLCNRLSVEVEKTIPSIIRSLLQEKEIQACMKNIS